VLGGEPADETRASCERSERERSWQMASGDDINFDLLIERRGDGYRARVYNSPFGEASCEFAPPLTDNDVQGFIAGRTRSRKRRDDPPIASSPKDVSTFAPQLYFYATRSYPPVFR
jgi:hypothetical protein